MEDTQIVPEITEQDIDMPILNKIPFAIAYGLGYSPKNNGSELTNMYVQISDPGSKDNHLLIGSEGAEYFAEVGETIYGITEFLGNTYVVTSINLYLYNRYNQSFEYKADVTFSKDVMFANNGIELVMVADNGYAYNPATGLGKDLSLDPAWFPSNSVDYMDGYFIFNRNESGQFFISKLYSTELDPIDWATGESNPDNTIAISVNNRQLWLFGEKSTEIWYDSGDPDFPFARIQGATSNIGLSDHKTIAKIKTSLLFVGDDYKVYQTNGYTPVVVSTPAIERAIHFADKIYISAFSFTSNGHWFYALTIDNKETFVYDVDTAQWHKRESSIGTGRWFIEGTYNSMYSNDLYGYSGAKIYRLSTDIYDEDSRDIKREITSLPVNDGVNRFRVKEVQLDMEVSLEDDTDVILTASKDGGRTWGNNNYSRLGKVGERLTRVRWLNLGQFRDCSFKITLSAKAFIRIIGLYIRTS